MNVFDDRASCSDFLLSFRRWTSAVSGGLAEHSLAEPVQAGNFDEASKAEKACGGFMRRRLYRSRVVSSNGSHDASNLQLHHYPLTADHRLHSRVLEKHPAAQGSKHRSSLLRLLSCTPFSSCRWIMSVI